MNTGGERIGNQGYFFQPTVLSEIPLDADVMNEEPFGPLALINPYKSEDDMIAEANRLPYGLAGYAWTNDVAASAPSCRRGGSGDDGNQQPHDRRAGCAVRRACNGRATAVKTGRKA